MICMMGECKVGLNVERSDDHEISRLHWGISAAPNGRAIPGYKRLFLLAAMAALAMADTQTNVEANMFLALCFVIVLITISAWC